MKKFKIIACSENRFDVEYVEVNIKASDEKEASRIFLDANYYYYYKIIRIEEMKG